MLKTLKNVFLHRKPQKTKISENFSKPSSLLSFLLKIKGGCFGLNNSEKMHKSGKHSKGLPFTFVSIKNFGIVRESNFGTAISQTSSQTFSEIPVNL